MNAINNDDMLQRVDLAAVAVDTAIQILRQAQAGEKDADLYGCSMNEAERLMTLVQVDLRSLGARY